MCGAPAHVRFTPNSDTESVFRHVLLWANGGHLQCHCRPCKRCGIEADVLQQHRPGRIDHSGLMPANLITLPHFSISSAMSFAKSAGDPPRAVPPRSVSRALFLGSLRAALISLLSLSIISTGVRLGTPTPSATLAS